MSWFSYTLLAVFSYAFYYLLSRVFLKQKNSDAVAYAILFNCICATFLSIIALSRGFILPDLGKYALNLLLMAVLNAAAQIFIFKASKAIEASELIILSSTRILWTIAAALFFLGEMFNLSKVIGTVLILFSVVFISYKKKQIKLNSGHWYAILAGFCLGIGFVNDSYILKQADAITYSALVFILPSFLTLILYSSYLSKLKKQLTFNLLLKTILLGVFYSGGLIASFAAYKSGGNASQIVPIGQSVVIITVILAALFLGERENLLKKLLAAILVSIGMLLLR